METWITAILAAGLGLFAGRLMALTIHYLPEFLYQDKDPREILSWFFFKPEKIKKSGRNIRLYEAGIALLFGGTALLFPFGPSLIFLWLASWILIACFFTDYEEGILPDQFTLGLIWIGLIGSLFSVTVAPSEAIIGAAGGYGIFWVLNELYKWFRGFDGMFPGDFKLNAGIGACVGFQTLIPILMISLLLLVLFTIVRIAMKGFNTQDLHKEMPYACSISIVAIITLLRLI